MPDTSRRSFITGLAALIAAPAIVRAGSLMPIKRESLVQYAGFIGDSVGFGVNDTTMMSIEYPIGFFTKVQSLGGVAQAVDLIIPQGETFWMRTFVEKSIMTRRPYNFDKPVTKVQICHADSQTMQSR